MDVKSPGASSGDRAASARRLLGAGASLRAVLLQCGIRQRELMRAAGLQPTVGEVTEARQRRVERLLAKMSAERRKRLLAEGLGAEPIADQLGVSLATIKADLQRIQEQRRHQPRVSHILARPDAPGSAQGARREGAELRLRVYRAAAKLLGIEVGDIPEARDVIQGDR